MRNCVDIVRPFSEAVTDRDDVQMIGGIGSVALTDSATIILPDEKRVIAPADLALPQYRPDGNLRDFDALVLSTNDATVAELEAIAQETIGNRLALSFFGLKPSSDVRAMIADPFRAMGQFVSDRYVTERDGQILSADKVLFPFKAEMEPDSFNPWQLYIGEHDRYPSPIPDPRTVIPNYLTRSISGLRPKDAAKVGDIADSVIAKMPDALEWLTRGPGREQLFLARILQTISRGGSLAVGNSLRLDPVQFGLWMHPQFMMKHARPIAQEAILDATRLKAVAVHKVESNGKLVTLWQRHVESRVDKFLHNDLQPQSPNQPNLA